MIRFPQKVPAQQAILGPLDDLIARVPACEQFITFTQNVDLYIDGLTAGALTNIAEISQQMHKVFDYLQMAHTQTIPTSRYLLTLSKSAYLQFLETAALAITRTDGTMQVSLTSDAQNALATLQAWDSVLGYQAPSDPGAVANRLMNGVSL